MLIPVYPIPFPASDVIFTDGVILRITGMSWPKLTRAISLASNNLKGTGVFEDARIAVTTTSSKFCLFTKMVSILFSCEKMAFENTNTVKIKFFIITYFNGILK